MNSYWVTHKAPASQVAYFLRHYVYESHEHEKFTEELMCKLPVSFSTLTKRTETIIHVTQHMGDLLSDGRTSLIESVIFSLIGGGNLIISLRGYY